MTRPMHLVAIVGSLRAESISRVVLDAAVELGPPAATITEVSLSDVPLYNGDVEGAADPEAVTALKQQVMAADGLVVFTPEYNRSLPAVTKNAIDWLTRMPRASALTDAAVGVVASTPGHHDAPGVRRHIGEILTLVAGHFFPETLGIGSMRDKMADGRLTDEEALDALRGWLVAFVDHIEKRPATT